MPSLAHPPTTQIQTQRNQQSLHLDRNVKLTAVYKNHLFAFVRAMPGIE